MKLKITNGIGSVWKRPLRWLTREHIIHLRRMLGEKKFSELSVLGKTEVGEGGITITYELIDEK